MTIRTQDQDSNSRAPVAKSVSLTTAGIVKGSLRTPGSKSITNRALICAAMAEGQSVLRGVLCSEDTEVMVDALIKLGIVLQWNRQSSTISIVGCKGKFVRSEGSFYIANSGTTIRFLSAALAASHGTFELHGVPRMHERPIADLMEGLNLLGANVSSRNEFDKRCPPVHIEARGLIGGNCRIAGNVSSQFLSGLMMASPYAAKPVEIQIEGELVSRPYVDMTSAVMKSFGVEVVNDSPNCFLIEAPQSYRGIEYHVEPDASAASYFFAAAAITGGDVRVLGLGKDALQGDVSFVDALRRMGCEVEFGIDTNGETYIGVRGRAEKGIDIDMGEISDTVQTLAAVAVFAKGPTKIFGVEHNRYKETDRIRDLATELRRVGVDVAEQKDGLTIFPRPTRPAIIHTYHDHRMAMSLALLSLRQEGIEILDPACTSKTYPRYFEDLISLTGQSLTYIR